MKLLFLVALVGVYADMNLYVNYYTDKSVVRQKELDQALAFNVANIQIDRVYLVVDDGCKYADKVGGKVVLLPVAKRPTFKDVLELIRVHSKPTDISLTCNSDIYFDQSLALVKLFYEQPKNHHTAMALARYEVNPNGSPRTVVTWADSQDSWILYGTPKNVVDIDYYYGLLACDPRFAYQLAAAGYYVINPSLSIITYHLHNSGIRYESAKQELTVPGPRYHVYRSRLPL
ncbi:Hypothetical protein POVN_LOCUS188 [uncultured virus]|nr:Hypothetical protein POVN_LOCUS188 [uncultured virus]